MMNEDLNGQPAKPIAISGSPNTITEISVDVMQEHLSKPLLGALLQLELPVHDYDGTESSVLVLGQVTNLQTQNRWHEDQGLKNYIKRRGRLPNLTGVGDVTTGKVQIIGTYGRSQDKYAKVRMSIPAGSGLGLGLVKRETVYEIMADEQNVAYIGHFYGPGNLPAPVLVRHFGDFKDGGTGEAYMGGVFGPSGCGKTALALTIDALWARSSQMGMLFLDPKGEIAQDRIAEKSSFGFSFHSMLKAATNNAFNPEKDVVKVADLRLDGFDLFGALIEREGIFKAIGVGDGKKAEALENFSGAVDRLSKASYSLGTSLSNISANEPQLYEMVKAAIIDACADAYVAGNREKKRQEFQAAWDSDPIKIHDRWDKVSARFSEVDSSGNKRPDLMSLVRDVMENGKKIIVDLSPGNLGVDDRYKLHLMHFAFTQIGKAAKQAYSIKGDINCMIVLDEAGRFISEGTSRDDVRSRMSEDITNKVREMRSFSVGFQFITQTINEIQKDIYRNLHYRVYGVGLAVGSEEQHIKDREGKEAFEMYSTLPDPRLSDIFSFMICGAIIAMGTTGAPMFIEGFKSDLEVMEENKLREAFERAKIAISPPRQNGSARSHRDSSSGLEVTR